MTKKYVLISFFGGIGDQIFQFSFANYLKNKLKCEVYVDLSYYQSSLNYNKLSFRLKSITKKKFQIKKNLLKIEDEKNIENNCERYITNNIFSGHHLIGGTQDAINGNFELKQAKSLYICDASIFDKYAASNIHSSVVLISDIFAKKFLANNKN